MAEPSRIATYRVQLHAGFNFDDVAAIAPYLAALGVSHVYCSPYLQAVPGSTHGYDVVDHSRVSEGLGGAAGHARMCAALDAAGLSQMLDVVPNHMAIGARENRWWWDVLENGPSSRWASYFDVDWDPPEAKLRNKVLLPVLGDHVGRALEAGEIRLERGGATFLVRYAEHVFPVSAKTLGPVLADAASQCGSTTLAYIGEACADLPAAHERDPAARDRRHRNRLVLLDLLARELAEDEAAAAAVDATLDALNADQARLLHLLDAQNYRLAYWRTAGEELDYRRFFDVTSLVALRTEDEHVFADTHALVLGLVHDGVLDGIRVDHPDGLADPTGYFQRLAAATAGTWIVAEKILADAEVLAPWPVAGTTGYDFLNVVGGVFCDPVGELALTDLHAVFTGASVGWEEASRAGREVVLADVLGADLERLTALLDDVVEDHPRHRDHTRGGLRAALRALLVSYPVYRTYVWIRDGRPEVRQADVDVVEAAVKAARAHAPDVDGELFEFIADLLLLRVPGDLEAEFATRVQQLSAPVMAKGVEDTAFYRWTRFVARNEVGGDPALFATSVADFHAANAVAAVRWPERMLATSTHDTKRSEDVRARLFAITEMPAAWQAAVLELSDLATPYRTGELPDRSLEYLLYQVLVGAHPLSVERACVYAEKAAREAKQHTSWLRPEVAYEGAVRTFVTGVLTDARFQERLEAAAAPLVAPGRVNSLAQTLLKLTSPGIPDLYQGTELWDLSLVDPDNRRPVDYVQRRALLEELGRDALDDLEDGTAKMLLIRDTLHIRRRHPASFAPGGSYTPLDATGAKANHVVAFRRGEDIVTVVPRLVVGLGAAWADTSLLLPSGEWTDAFTGAAFPGGTHVPLSDLLGTFPVALLTVG